MLGRRNEQIENRLTEIENRLASISETLGTLMSGRRATPHPNTCDSCPNKYAEQGCPCWVETIWKNDESGETSIVKGCFYEVALTHLLYTAKQANGAARSAEVGRNETVSELRKAIPFLAADSGFVPTPPAVTYRDANGALLSYDPER